MAQIQAPATYNNGDTVTAANLNNHVAGATLLAGAITDQISVSVLASGNQLLVDQSGLKRVTVGNLFATPQPIGLTTPSTVAATTLTASGSLSVGGTSAHTGAATFASTAAFTGAATFDVAPNFNGGANLGNLDADPVVMTCTLSGNPILSLGSPVTAVAADKILIQDASDASKLKLAAFPIQYVKAFARCIGTTPNVGIVSGSEFNVTSVVRSGLGQYQVTFPAMNSVNYVAIANTSPSVTAHCLPISTTVCNVSIYYPIAAQYYDADFSLVIFEV